MTERETERYQRNLLVEGFSATGQQRLSESRVTVVGAGGLGSATLNYLAAAGVGRLRIVENDTVSLSNLQRQILYTTADLDAPKAEVAAARLSRLNPACRIEIRTDRLDGGNADEILSDCDVVVDCTDNYATRYAIDDFCSARRIPMVYGTAEQIGGQVSVFNTAGAVLFIRNSRYNSRSSEYFRRSSESSARCKRSKRSSCSRVSATDWPDGC